MYWKKINLDYSVPFGEGNGNPLRYSRLANPMDGGAWWAAVHGVARSRTRLSDFTFNFSLSCIREGNGNPLQCSCLENPRDRGAWWASVYGVAQSQTQLTRLSSSSSNIGHAHSETNHQIAPSPLRTPSQITPLLIPSQITAICSSFNQITATCSSFYGVFISKDVFKD